MAGFEEMRARLTPDQVERLSRQFDRQIERIQRLRRRRPGEGGMPALVEPPRGPKPLAGGAAAPLEFDS